MVEAMVEAMAVAEDSSNVEARVADINAMKQNLAARPSSTMTKINFASICPSLTEFKCLRGRILPQNLESSNLSQNHRRKNLTHLSLTLKPAHLGDHFSDTKFAAVEGYVAAQLALQELVIIGGICEYFSLRSESLVHLNVTDAEKGVWITSLDCPCLQTVRCKGTGYGNGFRPVLNGENGEHIHFSVQGCGSFRASEYHLPYRQRETGL